MEYEFPTKEVTPKLEYIQQVSHVMMVHQVDLIDPQVVVLFL